MARSQTLCLLAAACTVCAGAISCASGLPAVVSSTSSEVAVEYERDGNLKEASELASSECKRYGLQAEFDSVAPAVSQQSNVAKYRCAGDSAATERE